MSTVRSEDIRPLLDKTMQLPTAELAALTLLAVTYAPVHRTTFCQCLQKAGLRIVQGKVINPADVLPLMKKLTGYNLVFETGGAYYCNPQVSHHLVRMAQQEELFECYAKAVQEVIAPRASWHASYYRTYAHCVQDIRIALYRGDHTSVTRLIEVCETGFTSEFRAKHPFLLVCGEPVDRQWVQEMPITLQIEIITFHLDRSLLLLQPAENSYKLLGELIDNRREPPADLLKLYLTQLLLRGNAQKAAALMKSREGSELDEMHGWLAVLQGDDDRAMVHFERGLAFLRKETGKRKVFFHGLPGIFYFMAVVRSGLPHQLQAAVELGDWVVKQRCYFYQFAIWMLYQYAEVKLGKNRSKHELVTACNRDQNLSPVSQLFHALVGHWLPDTVAAPHLKALVHIQSMGASAGYLWLAAEAALLLKHFDPRLTACSAQAIQLLHDEEIISLSERDDSDKNWERTLKALISFGSTNPEASRGRGEKASRIVWLVTGNENHLAIQPVEQKQTARGWTGGRNMALKRLSEEGMALEYLSPQDREIVGCLKKYRSAGYYGSEYYEFDTVRAIRAMVGHPLVFQGDNREEQISVSKGEFVFEVTRQKKGLSVRLIPEITSESGAFIHWEKNHRLLLFEPSTDQRRIAGIIGERLMVPKEGEAQVLAAITAVSPHVAVHSDVAGENSAVATVAPDARIQVMLRPYAAGISLELLLLPLGEGGPRFCPGRGGRTVIAEVKGKKLQTSRKLEDERELCSRLVDACPTLLSGEARDGIWRMEGVELSLELLEELHAVVTRNDGMFCINWPEGERLRLKGRAEWPKLKLSVHSGREWFSLSGELSVSDDEVLSLQRLMELVEGTPGRFVQLAEGEFLSLTEEFRRKLQDLGRLIEKNGRFTPLIAPLIDDTLQGAAGMKGDKHWKGDMARFRSSQELLPIVPPSLEAELRDYQREGFDWLSRLAHWGVGACLADDMGLGKTVQALALLLTRAATGPALVLAPTSVCLNWESEARRFAPTLLPRIFGAGNRKEFIASLAPFDLVICSYTLFQQESQLLTEVNWETAVLDEAQAIKNMTTKRSQAAMQLKAGFRVAMSGTPVENRLDELWNLFHFLNPGLLGSHKSFSSRFSIAIEKNGDKTARTLLKRLIRPFILRRTKSQVLEELPPRTEIVLRVELSREESAFYEALRRNAVEKLSATGDAPSGERQIRILAEIMRLRRACCNPLLVLPAREIASSKLAAFRELVTELLENGHRVLVFSQFVDHLTILRRSLENDGISYQYLDGATPPKERQLRVAAFQRGEGDLFLISLKAGGVGLNLTAADYVIHMDPWWNPAVEDQASDRAHRIGQTRPVTVYRLVANNTIEEKIVALHHQKRDLADSLLEGAETSARVSADDLLELLRDVNC